MSVGRSNCYAGPIGGLRTEIWHVDTSVEGGKRDRLRGCPARGAPDVQENEGAVRRIRIVRGAGDVIGERHRSAARRKNERSMRRIDDFGG